MPWTTPRRVGMLFYCPAGVARREARHRSLYVMRPKPFAIHLLPETMLDLEGRRMGEIRVGSFVERFTVFPFLGSVEAVAALWTQELNELAAGASAVGLPTASNMTWILYRRGASIKVHQMLLLRGCKGLPRKTRPSGPKLLKSGRVTSIPPYRAIDDEGHRISEWSTTLAAIRAFLAAQPPAAS